MDKLKKELLELVKKKKELSGLEDVFIMESIDSLLAKSDSNKDHMTEKDKKHIVKKVRAELRRFSGRFQKNTPIRKSLIDKDNVAEILETHSSTKERLDFYPELKKLIVKLKVKSILDLGCGLNPLALANQDLTYYATDTKKDELDLINTYFSKKNITGKAFYYDLRKIDNSLPEVDICFIFKVFDVIEQDGHKIAEKIVSNIKTKYFLISFPTKTLSGKPMNHPQRGWIERMLTRLDYKIEVIKSFNEIYYLAYK